MQCSCHPPVRNKKRSTNLAQLCGIEPTGIFWENDTSRSTSWSERLDGEAREERKI